MHWHLDVIFREDANTTIDKVAAENQNVIRKWCLSILKMAELSTKMKGLFYEEFYEEAAENLDICVPIGYNTVIVKGIKKEEGCYNRYGKEKYLDL